MNFLIFFFQITTKSIILLFFQTNLWYSQARNYICSAEQGTEAQKD